MRVAIGALLLLICGVGVSACGSAARHSSEGLSRPASTHSTPAPARAGASADANHSDTDDDNDTGGYYDKDDYPLLLLGSPAAPAVRLAISTLVRLYLKAAASADGARACSLLYSLLAEEAPEVDAVESSGPSASARGTCAAVLSQLFIVRRRQLEAEARTLSVGVVRIAGSRGYVLLRFGASAERYLDIHREQGRWRIASVLDTGLP